MADITNKQKWLVKEDNDVKKKWLQCKIQETRSLIVRLEQDIEDLKKGRIVELEAIVIMRKKELDKLQNDYDNLDKVVDVESN